MKASLVLALALGLATAGTAHAQYASDVPYAARAFNSAHADLPRSAGMPARLANEEYVEALARIVYYWAYPAIDVTSRTSMWELMKDGPGLMNGIGPGSPVNESGCLSGYLPPTQRIVVTPNNDTFYGAAFLDLGREPVVIQTPTDVPEGHYWVMQITDVFTNVIRTLGSAWGTPGGKFLLVGPTGRATIPRASSRSSVCRPTTAAFSRAASRRAPPRPGRAPSRCRTRWAPLRDLVPVPAVMRPMPGGGAAIRVHGQDHQRRHLMG